MFLSNAPIVFNKLNINVLLAINILVGLRIPLIEFNCSQF